MSIYKFTVVDIRNEDIEANHTPFEINSDKTLLACKKGLTSHNPPKPFEVPDFRVGDCFCPILNGPIFKIKNIDKEQA